MRRDHSILKRLFCFVAVAGMCMMPLSAQQEDKTGDYPNLKEVIVIYKTHFDIGYSAYARDVVHKYRTEMLDHTLVNIEKNSKSPKNEQFVWTIPGWPMTQILWDGQEPSRKSAIEKAFRSGNLVVHALPYTTHTETLELEDIIRGIGYATDISKKYGLEIPRAAKMTDAPSHVWSMPTILAHSGVEFFHVGTNTASQNPDIPELFWWEGPDGSRVLTMASLGYGTSPTPPKGWPYSAWMYVNQTGDNEGPPSPETVQKDLAQYRKTLPGVKVKIGQLSDFSDAIKKNKNPEIPVIKGDMPDSWIHGLMSSPACVALSRTTRPLIAAGEALQTLGKSWGVFLPDETDTYAKAYEQSLMFGEHTWGYAAQHYRAQPYDNFEEQYKKGLPAYLKWMQNSWDEHDQYIKDAANYIVKPINNEISSLADNVSVEGNRIVVFNSLPWTRSGIVETNIVYWPQAKALKAVDNGEIIPIQAIGEGEANKKNIITFVAKDIPAMGYRTFVLETKETASSAPLKADRDNAVIESPYFKVKLDPVYGRIESLVDKRTGKELVDASAPQGFGSYLYERFSKKEADRYLQAYVHDNFRGMEGIFSNAAFSKDSKYQSAATSNMKLYIEESPIEVSAIMICDIDGCGMPQSATIKVTLYADMPYADVEVSVDKKPEGHTESGWICLPFNIENPSYRVGRLGAIIDPTKDIVNNCNFHQIWSNTGIAMYNDNGGVGICPMDSPLVSLGEPGSMKFSYNYTPKNPYLYINLFNNQWTTNFREFWGGRLTSRVRLWTFDKYDNESSLVTPAMEARTPLLSARSSCKPGKLPSSQAGLVLSQSGVAVTTFAKNPDGNGLILRLWEQTGKSGVCSVTLPEGMNVSSIQPVDLRGRVLGKPIAVKNRTFNADIKAFAPASFVINK